MRTGVPRGSSLARVVMSVLVSRMQPWLTEWPMLAASAVPCSPIWPGMLLTTVADLLDDDLVNNSVGLLRGGAIAWVEVSMPDTIASPDGVTFRPNLLATTSFDGSTPPRTNGPSLSPSATTSANSGYLCTVSRAPVGTSVGGGARCGPTGRSRSSGRPGGAHRFCQGARTVGPGGLCSGRVRPRWSATALT